LSDYGNFRHSRRDCKYHVVSIRKFRRKQLFGQVRKYLVPIFHVLARQKESTIIQGQMMPDHVHMCICIAPKHSVTQVKGYLKGKSAIPVARQFGGRKRNFNGESLWARGYAVSTVGFGLEQVSRHIREQSKRDMKEDHDNF